MVSKVSFSPVQVWGVLKPGFLALLEDPFDAKLLDIIVFDVLPVSNGNDGVDVSLAVELKDHNPLRHAFKVSNYCPTYLLINYMCAYSI